MNFEKNIFSLLFMIAISLKNVFVLQNKNPAEQLSVKFSELNPKNFMKTKESF
jgi:hypothetical protein